MCAVDRSLMRLRREEAARDSVGCADDFADVEQLQRSSILAVLRRISRTLNRRTV